MEKLTDVLVKNQFKDDVTYYEKVEPVLDVLLGKMGRCNIMYTDEIEDNQIVVSKNVFARIEKLKRVGNEDNERKGPKKPKKTVRVQSKGTGGNSGSRSKYHK